MKKIVEFIKDCDAFFVVTKNCNFPSARPYKAIMEYNGKLFIGTNTKHHAYKQILKDNHIHVIAIKRSTRTWIRFNAVAKLNNNIKIKELFFKKVPVLINRYKKSSNKIFIVYELKVSKFELHND